MKNGTQLVFLKWRNPVDTSVKKSKHTGSIRIASYPWHPDSGVTKESFARGRVKVGKSFGWSYIGRATEGEYRKLTGAIT